MDEGNLEGLIFLLFLLTCSLVILREDPWVKRMRKLQKELKDGDR